MSLKGKIFNFDEANLSFFSLLICAFCVQRNLCLTLNYKDYYLFYSRNYIVLTFEFMSKRCSKLTFVYGDKNLLLFLVSNCRYSIVSAAFVEKFIFFSLSYLGTFVKNNLTLTCGYVSRPCISVLISLY